MFWSTAWGRPKGLGALAQVFAGTAILFSRDCVVPATKRVVVDLMQFAVQKTADVVIGRKSFESAAKSVGMQSK